MIDISKPFERRFPLDRGAKIDEANRTIVVSFSSESPIKQPFGVEILDHGSGSCDLSRLNAAGPVVVEHDNGDQVGVVESATITDRRGKAVLRFGETQRSSDIWSDVKMGIRRNVSVKYLVNNAVEEGQTPDGEPIYRVTKWLPTHISIVAEPADVSVGVGRSLHNSMNRNQ